MDLIAEKIIDKYISKVEESSLLHYEFLEVIEMLEDLKYELLEKL